MKLNLIYLPKIYSINTNSVSGLFDPSLVLLSLSSGAEDSEEINEDYDKGYSELNNEIDGQVIKKSCIPNKV